MLQLGSRSWHGDSMVCQVWMQRVQHTYACPICKALHRCSYRDKCAYMAALCMQGSG